MTDRLAAMGSVDQIRDVLNPPFEVIINTVHRYFGSVIKLAGDSAIVAWTIPPKLKASLMQAHQIPDSEAELIVKENICRLALLCCMELLEQFDDYVVHVNSEGILLRAHSKSTKAEDHDSVNEAAVVRKFPWSRTSSQKRKDATFDQRSQSAKHVEEESQIHHSQRLSLHIGLGFGDIHHVFVGSSPVGDQNKTEAKPAPRRSEYFISGHALYDAGIMLSKGTSGMLVFSPRDIVIKPTESLHLQSFIDNSTGDIALYLQEGTLAEFELLQNALASNTLPRKVMGGCESHFLLDDRTCKSDPHLLAFIEPSLTKCLLEQHEATEKSAISLTQNVFSDNLNQYRTIIVVFVHLPNIPIEHLGVSSRIMDDVNFAAEEVIRAATEHGGTCRQFHADEKGLSALLVWGVAGFAHERGDHTNALSAALCIQKLFEKRDWWAKGGGDSAQHRVAGDFSIAVTMGKAFCGFIGTDNRSEGTVLGPCVNLAARIMCDTKCRGQVLCDEELANACGSTVTLDDAGVIRAKGILKPVHIFSPKELVNFRSETHEESVTLEGRDEELGRLSLALRNWIHGERAFILVAGKSGFGKTQLLQESFPLIFEGRKKNVDGSDHVIRSDVSASALITCLLTVLEHLPEFNERVALFIDDAQRSPVDGLSLLQHDT
ncbi:Adenylate cyclase type 10 [Phlyctochytrium planicorne]|nr:Adenylate cyclase type 10 [Phlyctochytrium planicorne]